MNLTERFFEATAEVRDQANAYAERAVDAARDGVKRAADQVGAVETPIETLAKASHELNAITHRYFERMIEQNVDTLKGALDDGARRMRLVAKADGITGLYSDQVKFADVTTDRLTRDAKATWTILADAGQEISEVALSTYAKLMQPKVMKSRVRKVVKTAKTRAKKAA
jgi:hypothetical protein